MVTERGDEQEGFFIGLIEDGESLEGFDGIEGSELVDFFPVECLTKKDLFRCRIREAPDHAGQNTLKGEQGKSTIRLFVYFEVLATKRAEFRDVAGLVGSMD